MKLFHAPAVADEFMGEIVQELRICRRGACFAEITDRDNDAFAEIFVPDAVHIDACRQWIGLAPEPIRQGEPASRRHRRRLDVRLSVRVGFWESRLYLLQRPFVIAAEEDVSGRRIGMPEFCRARDRVRTLGRPKLVEFPLLYSKLPVAVPFLAIGWVVILG